MFSFLRIIILNKLNHLVKHVDMGELTDINQAISMNQFYQIKALIFIREFFVFPQFIIIQYCQLMWKEFVIQISEKPDICVVASWNCL